MKYSLIWLPEVLKAAGLKVATVDGWESRGRGDVGTIHGVLCHHTVGRRDGNMPSLNVLVNGRSDLPGPLAQLGLGRDGTFYVIGAGRCNHAGKGNWKGVTNGNSSFIGIEAENTGMPNDTPWPEVQIEAYCRGVAAILQRIGRSFEYCAGHKEYALPKGRKPDPNFDMVAFRARVKAIMENRIPPILIPAAEPVAAHGATPRPTLRRGATGEHVKAVQKAVGAGVDGDFGAKTEARVRAWQREHGLVPDGIVGPKSWRIIDAIEVAGTGGGTADTGVIAGG